MSSMPLSIRFDEPVLANLRRTARQRAATPSGLAMRLVDEGLRSIQFGGITFRDGPTGRRAGIIGGPDVWEVIVALTGTQSSGENAINEVAAEFSLPAQKVRNAISYYGKYADEIDQEIADNQQASEQAYQAWLNEQRVLA
jgi:hypothetical protein